jgi:large subunit ribosomal protein L27
MAHKKAAGGGIRQHKNPSGKRLGVKKYQGEKVSVGTIIIRQKGTKILPGTNVGLGKDFTVYATSEGVVEYKKVPGNGSKKKVNVVAA